MIRFHFTGDLFVGRWIWLDALEKGIAAAIPTRIGVLFCNLIGPPGFLIYWVASQLLLTRGGQQKQETTTSTTTCK
jgi:Domain of unknown function (DUF4281)